MKLLKHRSTRCMFVPLFWLIMMIAFTAIAVWESIRDTWHPIVLWILDWEMCEGSAMSRADEIWSGRCVV
jgi:hypothetical protein